MQKNMRIRIDEVGRGPLAGPLYVGLVIIHQPSFSRFAKVRGVTDSKLLTHPKRALIADAAFAKAGPKTFSYALAKVTHSEIDKRGMTKSLNTAIQRGLKQLFGKKLPKEAELVIDGNKKFGLEKDLDCKITTVIKGDQKHRQIGLASILAKVTRDAEMVAYHKKYPKYGFHIHKGYGTEKHRKALHTHGACSIHRKLFLRKILG